MLETFLILTFRFVAWVNGERANENVGELVGVNFEGPKPEKLFWTSRRKKMYVCYFFNSDFASALKLLGKGGLGRGYRRE